MCEKAMGIERFDVDMYSCEEAQKVVQAKEYYTDRVPFRLPPNNDALGMSAFCNPPGSCYAEAWGHVLHFDRFCWVGFNWSHVHRLSRLFPGEGPLRFSTVLLPSRVRFTPGPGLKESSPSKDSYVTFSDMAHAESFRDLYRKSFDKECALL